MDRFAGFAVEASCRGREGRRQPAHRGRGPARLIAAACLALSVLAAGPCAAAPLDAKPPSTAAELPAHVESWHTITLGKRTLDYQAVAETFPLTNAAGAQTASIFAITYLAKLPSPGKSPASATNRPVSFVFNGGPGAASVFLHLGALGPRILATTDSGAPPTPPIRLIDNPATWLGFTDLVFVDPVGTGFSRGTGRGDNPDRPFFDVTTDLQSLDAVVRLWLTRYQRWDSPIYLVGESYGGFRVAAMAESLMRDVGVTPSGVIMISPALDLSVLHADERDLIAAAAELPSYAASAAVLAGRPEGPRDAAAVEHFALSDFLVGLANLVGEPPPDDAFTARVARLAGLPPDIVRRYRGRVPRQVFAREIRRADGQTVSIYDATVSRAAPGAEHGMGDPVLDPAIADYTAAFNTYAPRELGYHTRLPYRVLPRDISEEWDWQGAEQGENGLGLALSSLQDVLLQHPGTKIMIVNGRYDLVTPYLASRWLVDQLAIPAAARAAIRLRVYDGGHMMYMRPSSRAALARDAAALYEAGGAAPPG